MLYGPIETAYVVMYGDNYLDEAETWISMDEADAQELVLSLWEEYLYEQYCNDCLIYGYVDVRKFWDHYKNYHYDYDYLVQFKEVPLY